MTTDIQKPSYMSDGEFHSWKKGDTTMHQSYTVQPKRDFGAYGYRVVTNHSDGTFTADMVKVGWVVTKNGALATPGAGWDLLHADAMKTIAALSICDSLGITEGHPARADVFHNLIRLTK